MAKNTVIIVIRHAEKPDSGRDLAPAGVKRSEAYVPFFAKYHVGPRLLTIDALFAATDSKASIRPRLTLTPLSTALHLPINTDFEDKNTDALAARLLSDEYNGKTIIVCWKHGQIIALANALVGKPEAVPKQANWPTAWSDDEFAPILQIVYGDSGALDVANTYCIQHPALE